MEYGGIYLTGFFSEAQACFLRNLAFLKKKFSPFFFSSEDSSFLFCQTRVCVCVCVQGKLHVGTHLICHYSFTCQFSSQRHWNEQN